MEERSIKISLDKAKEWYNQGGELKELALSAFSEKEITESALPNSWEEFCKMYSVKNYEWHINTMSEIKGTPKGTRYSKFCRNSLPSQQAAEAHLAYMQLHQLRDCYRQGWKPDWSDSKQWKWYICLNTDIFSVECNFNFSRFLSFQSREIAEKFLNNFKYLIETAGDLI